MLRIESCSRENIRLIQLLHRRFYLQAAILVTSALIGTSCSPGEFEDTTFSRHSLMEWVNQDAFPYRATAARPLDDLVLYLDASGSMQGYTDPAGQFEYSRSLRAIRNVVDQLRPKHSLLFRRLDTTVAPLPANDQTLLSASRSARFYDGKSSNIAGAIRSFKDLDNEKSAGLARCHILITDGVQHTSIRTPDPRCAAGSDPRCVNEAVSALIDKGWGVHIFGVRSRFNGPIYSEVNGKWLEGNYNAADPLNYSKYRPFLIFVFTKEGDYLEHLVDKLRDALLKSGIRKDLIRELPLTLPLVKGSRLSLNTDIYSVKDNLRVDELITNPLLHKTDGVWREDLDGSNLPDQVQILEYSYDDIDFLQPCAVRISAVIDFTTAGEILFGETTTDAGTLLKPLTVREVDRPKLWYTEPAKKAPPTRQLRGSGRLPSSVTEGNHSDATEDNYAAAAGADDARPTPLDDESQQALVWPPPQSELKHLRFDATLQDAVPNFLALNEEVDKTPSCSLNGGCHLVLRWSQAGDYLPITLLRIDGLLDPAKIQLPSWIEEWSTEDDSRLSSANRLFNLGGLVRGLQENEHIAKQGLKPWYLVIWPTKQR